MFMEMQGIRDAGPEGPGEENCDRWQSSQHANLMCRHSSLLVVQVQVREKCPHCRVIQQIES